MEKPPYYEVINQSVSCLLRVVCFFAIVGTLFFGFSVFGAPEPTASPPEAPKDSIIKDLVNDDVKLTQDIREAASAIDVWLAGERLVDTTNLTHIVVRNQLNWPSGGPFAYNPLLNLSLRLPNFEKKWELKFVSYDEDRERGIERDRLRTTPIQSNYAGGVGFFQKLGNIAFSFEPRVLIQGGLQASYFANITTSAKGEYFTIHPDVQFFAKSDTGLGEYFSSNVDIPLYKSLSLTLVDEEQYLDQVDIFSTNLGLGLTYLYNDTMSHGYALIYEASSRPVYNLTRYSIATTFTHKVLKNVFQYMIQPYLAFPTPEFDIQPGINFEFDIIF